MEWNGLCVRVNGLEIGVGVFAVGFVSLEDTRIPHAATPIPVFSIWEKGGFLPLYNLHGRCCLHSLHLFIPSSVTCHRANPRQAKTKTLNEPKTEGALSKSMLQREGAAVRAGGKQGEKVAYELKQSHNAWAEKRFRRAERPRQVSNRRISLS